MENSQFTASSFDVVFYRSNSSVSFQVSAISTLSGNFTAKLSVIAYGFDVINESLDLCDLSTEQLCPMTPGHFDVPLSSAVISKDIISNVPGIAFTIPDLDGVVRVTVYPVDDLTTPVACVEATLSNDKTVSTKYAAWPLAAICFFGLFVAGIVWLYGHISTSAHISSNIMSLFCYFQGLAIISMMAVEKLPPIAAAWGQNFVWTMGLISVPFMQDIFNWYVQATGGTSTNILPNASIMSISVQKVKRSVMDSAGAFMSRYFSPLIQPTPIAVDQTSIPRNVAYFMSHDALKVAGVLGPALLKRASNDTISPEETTDETLDDYSATTLVLQGIQRVAFLANIEITSLFLTGFTFFLIICVFALLFTLILKLIIELLVKTRAIQSTSFLDFRNGWRTVIKGVLYRLSLLAFPQLTVLCLWELTKHDSPAVVALAVISYLVIASLLGFGAYKTITLARRSMRLHKNPAYILYSDPASLNRWGFLYTQFRATAYFYIIPLLIYLFIKCCIIAFAQPAGKVQAVCIFVVELGYLIFISWYKPYMDKSTNGFNIGISAINFVNALFFLFFSSIFGLPAYVAGVMGVVYFILNAVFSLILLIMVLVSCVWAVFAKNPETRYQPMTDDRESFIPNPDGDKKLETELDALGASARDGYPSSQELYNDPRSLRDDPFDDPSLYDSRSPYNNDSMSSFPNERLSHSTDRPNDGGQGDLGSYADYSSSSTRLHREASSRNSPTSTAFLQPTAYTGYLPSSNESYSNNYRNNYNSEWKN